MFVLIMTKIVIKFTSTIMQTNISRLLKKVFRVRTAPQQPPTGVRVTLIEDDTALVSWREPEEPSVVVTHYTILYASQKAWLAGKWQIMQREGE